MSTDWKFGPLKSGKDRQAGFPRAKWRVGIRIRRVLPQSGISYFVIEDCEAESMGKSKKRIRVFAELEGALKDAIRYEEGDRIDLRVTELPSPSRIFKPREIRRIRQSLNASQARFARFLNVSANTVKSWEQGTRQPQHAALKLLAIARKWPRTLLES